MTTQGKFAGVSVLIVEDDLLLRKQLAAQMERLGADVTAVDSLAKAGRSLEGMGFDFALLDVNLPDGSSLELLRAGAIPKTTGVVVMTADGGVETAVEAMRLGALEYLAKPFDPAELPLILQKARRARQQSRAAESRREREREKEEEFVFGNALAGLKAQLDRILAADTRLGTQLPPVLIQGETGTGKTTIARWLHHRGPRQDGPLVEINCSALPETLAESELFGHEKGAFTDARSGRIGLFEAADGGTLFLDELPSLAPALQSKVLKAIEDQKIRRVGGSRELSVDARIIAATNIDLDKAVAEGKFREDLLHRLDLFRVMIPPLRERGEDIAKLADYFLAKLGKRHRLEGRRLSEGARRALAGHRWPGNVRQLGHEIERALVFEDGEILELHGLRQSSAPTLAPNGSDWFNPGYVFPGEGFKLEEAVMRLIRHALAQSRENVSAAARLLGVSRDYLRYRLDGKGGEGGDGG